MDVDMSWNLPLCHWNNLLASVSWAVLGAGIQTSQNFKAKIPHSLTGGEMWVAGTASRQWDALAIVFTIVSSGLRRENLMESPGWWRPSSSFAVTSLLPKMCGSWLFLQDGIPVAMECEPVLTQPGTVCWLSADMGPAELRSCSCLFPPLLGKQDFNVWVCLVFFFFRANKVMLMMYLIPVADLLASKSDSAKLQPWAAVSGGWQCWEAGHSGKAAQMNVCERHNLQLFHWWNT